MSDWLYYVDGELDDVSPEERAALAAEAAEEWRAEEEQTEAEDRDRALRGERDQDARR